MKGLLILCCYLASIDYKPEPEERRGGSFLNWRIIIHLQIYFHRPYYSVLKQIDAIFSLLKDISNYRRRYFDRYIYVLAIIEKSKVDANKRYFRYIVTIDRYYSVLHRVLNKFDFKSRSMLHPISILRCLE